MSTPATDVLIAGAGPVGLTLAAACRRFGVRFRIVERALAPTDKSKALAIWSGTLELLAALGLAETFVRRGMVIKRVRINDHGRPVGEVPVDEGVDSRYAWPVIVPQSRTEALLEAHLAERGVKVERGTELAGLDQREDGVTCRLRRADGATEEVAVRYVAGCDGARSFVRHQLPVQFEGETVDANFILIDARLRGGGPPPDGVFVNWAKGPVVLFPVEPGLWRVFSTRPTMENQETPTVEEFQALFDGSGLGHWQLHDPVWLSYFKVNERAVNRQRVGRVFLCGDAAHIHSPAGGQGMNTGLQDAWNLAWKLKLLAEGVADPEAVAESFQAERHPVARAVVGGSGKLLRAALEDNPVFTKLRGFVAPFVVNLPAVHRFAAGKLSELDISYGQSPLVDGAGPWPKAGGGFAPGHRVRDALLQTAGGAVASLWDQTFADDYTLIFFSGLRPGAGAGAAAAELAAAARAARPGANLIGVWHGYDTPAAAAPQWQWFRDVAGAAHARCGVGRETAWYLARPDQYVAARAQPGDAEALRRALAPVAARG